MKIGWIGVGLMGSRMSKRLLDAGHELYVQDTSTENVSKMIEQGAKSVDSPAKLVSCTEVIFTMIPNAAVLQSIVNGHNGILKTMPVGFIIVDMSTIDPDSSAEIAACIEEASGHFLRSTVTGSTGFAENGTLGIMASGEKSIYNKVLPLFAVMGNRYHYLGDKEQARYMKICINMMIGTSMQMMAESIVLGKKAELDWKKMIECLCDSAAASSIMKAKKEMFKNRDFSPMCTAATLEKDMEIALSLGKKHALSLPLTALTKQNYSVMRSHDMDSIDYAGILLVNEILCGLYQPEGL